MIPGWELPPLSGSASSTSSVKLEIKPGLVSFDNCHKVTNSEALRASEHRQPGSATTPASPLPASLGQTIPAHCSTPCRLGPRVAAPTMAWSPGIPEPSPDLGSAEILAVPGFNVLASPDRSALTSCIPPGTLPGLPETPIPVFTPLSLEL